MPYTSLQNPTLSLYTSFPSHRLRSMRHWLGAIMPAGRGIVSSAPSSAGRRKRSRATSTESSMDSYRSAYPIHSDTITSTCVCPSGNGSCTSSILPRITLTCIFISNPCRITLVRWVGVLNSILKVVLAHNCGGFLCDRTCVHGKDSFRSRTRSKERQNACATPHVEYNCVLEHSRRA